MKTALVIIGACLLLLTAVTADELEKKQSIDCLNLKPDLVTCIANFEGDSNDVCSSDCRSALTEYYEDCIGTLGFETFKQTYAILCGDAAILGATIFTTISAVLVAVATVIN